MTWAVRDQLAASRRIELEPYRILGVLPAQRIIIRDPLVRDRIVGAIDAALSDAWPVGARTAALVALAAAAVLRARNQGRPAEFHRFMSSFCICTGCPYVDAETTQPLPT